MKHAFQDREHLYLLLDYLGGGDLRFHLNDGFEFTEEQTKFICCCVLSALEEVHKFGILHRDLKPENLIFDNQGYLHLTDFGIARYWKPDNGDQTSGTPGYMAPEVLMKLNHSTPVDFYALGVILYEIVIGQRPYLGKTRKEIKEKIIARQKQISYADLPDKSWSCNSADFINLLIQRKPGARLGGNGGVEEVKKHQWLQGFDWDMLIKREIETTFKPDPKEKGYVNQINSSVENETDRQNFILLKRNNIQELFNEYDYDPDVKQTPSQNITNCENINFLQHTNKTNYTQNVKKSDKFYHTDQQNELSQRIFDKFNSAKANNMDSFQEEKQQKPDTVQILKYEEQEEKDEQSNQKEKQIKQNSDIQVKVQNQKSIQILNDSIDVNCNQSKQEQINIEDTINKKNMSKDIEEEKNEQIIGTEMKLQNFVIN